MRQDGGGRKGIVVWCSQRIYLEVTPQTVIAQPHDRGSLRLTSRSHGSISPRGTNWTSEPGGTVGEVRELDALIGHDVEPDT